MDYRLTKHADDVLSEREIPLDLLERVLSDPTLKRPDNVDPNLECWYRGLPEAGNRVHKVVVDPNALPVRVIAVYFDRSMKGKL